MNILVLSISVPHEDLDADVQIQYELDDARGFGAGRTSRSLLPHRSPALFYYVQRLKTGNFTVLQCSEFFLCKYIFVLLTCREFQDRSLRFRFIATVASYIVAHCSLCSVQCAACSVHRHIYYCIFILT